MKHAEFDTPCGFRIVLVLDDDRNLIMKATYSGLPVSFVNSDYRLCEAGAAMLSDEIARLYASGD